MSRVSVRLAAMVKDRARGRCEYCRFPELFTEFSFEVEHVIASKHRGKAELSNLAYACLYCNRYKGPNVAGVDPQSGEIVRLFNPRTDSWEDHFAWAGPVLKGLTPVGRVTIEVLRINHFMAVAVRGEVLAEGISL